MKAKSAKPRLTIADAVYSALDQLDGASEKLVMRRAAKLCGKSVPPAQFKRALRSIYSRGVG